MALTELQRKECERAMGALLEKRRPPAHIRPQLDIGIRVSDQSVEVFQVRPRWDEPKEKVESPIAKATYVKRQDMWKVFWMRHDLKWHRYAPAPEVSSLEEFA